MTDGYGTITWWGFSPAIDLQNKDIAKAVEDIKLAGKEEDDDINILIVGAGDPRHILKTIAWSYRHPKRKLNFYVIENNLELYARYLLLITIALEQPTRMGLQEKTELFLEIFGNTLVRQQSIDYVEKMSTEFIKMVTDFDYLHEKLPFIDFSPLKFKERDMLEGIFKFWRTPDTKTFDISKCWDLRLRQYLGVRYDAIPNVFDWDFNMKLVDKGAGIINNHRYKHWRHKGIGFEIREGTYDVSNRTLASGMVFKHEGEALLRRGYWGDVVVSPYLAYGIESEEQSFFKKSNKQYTQTSQEVSEYNVLSILHEIATGKKYIPPKVEEKSDVQPTATLTEITEEDEETIEDTVDSVQTLNGANPLQQEYTALPVENVTISFLPLASAAELHKKSKYNNLFNTVYFSNSMVHHLSQDLSTTFANKANIILETAKFMLDLKPEQTEMFVKKVCGIARSVGCEVCGSISEKDDIFLKFLFNKKSS